MGVRMSPYIPAPMHPYYQCCAHVPVSHGPPELEPIVKVQHNTEGKLTEEGLNSYSFNLVHNHAFLLGSAKCQKIACHLILSLFEYDCILGLKL